MNSYSITLEPRNSTKNSSGVFLAASGLVLYSRGTDNAEETVPLLRSANHTENTSHVIAKHCLDVTSLRLRRSVFTKPLPRNGLPNPVVPLLERGLLRNSRFCGSIVLAWGKYATVLFMNVISICYPMASA
jgi:hypothetical protein